jgi:hypothetical protein
MKQLQLSPQTITNLDITVNIDELAQKIRTSTARPTILATAEATLKRFDGIWKPALVYRWLPVSVGNDGAQQTALLTDPQGVSVSLHLGRSCCFMHSAECAMVAGYTAGREIEQETMNASSQQQFFTAFILDLIGLLVLEKTGNLIMKIAEKKAKTTGRKVGPFLSPGSVHGWKLEEQSTFCSLLPLTSIGITLGNNGILTPFKSLSCMIGIGSGYSSSKVGTACQVCARNSRCEMQQST